MSRVPESQPTDKTESPPLKRALGLGLLTLYGLGTTIGAGIYVLVGAVAGSAGVHAPLAFLVAAGLAAFTVFSFAELSSRFPKSAGEALYVHAASGKAWLALLVGCLVILAGIVSAAAISRGFVGYLHDFVALPGDLAVPLLIALLTGLAIWGIAESVAVAAIATLIEVAGLLVVIVAGWRFLPDPATALQSLVPPLEAVAWPGILGGAVLAFYAFIGFEDMVNVAEEVKQPRRTLPRAILLTLGLTTLFYLALVLIAVHAVPLSSLAESPAPLALLFHQTTGASSQIISAIAIVAVLNGALVQIIMAARVIYGLSHQGWLPAALGAVNSRTRTPLRATLLVGGIVLAFALWLPLVTLAQITSLIALTIFAAVNLALLVIKRRGPAPEGAVTYPSWIPAAGLVASASFVIVGLLDFLL